MTYTHTHAVAYCIRANAEVETLYNFQRRCYVLSMRGHIPEIKNWRPVSTCTISLDKLFEAQSLMDIISITRSEMQVTFAAVVKPVLKSIDRYRRKRA